MMMGDNQFDKRIISPCPLNVSMLKVFSGCLPQFIRVTRGNGFFKDLGLFSCIPSPSSSFPYKVKYCYKLLPLLQFFRSVCEGLRTGFLPESYYTLNDRDECLPSPILGILFYFYCWSFKPFHIHMGGGMGG